MKLLQNVALSAWCEPGGAMDVLRLKLAQEPSIRGK